MYRTSAEETDMVKGCIPCGEGEHKQGYRGSRVCVLFRAMGIVIGNSWS